jgi:hypothetical protein
MSGPFKRLALVTCENGETPAEIGKSFPIAIKSELSRHFSQFVGC